MTTADDARQMGDLIARLQEVAECPQRCASNLISARCNEAVAALVAERAENERLRAELAKRHSPLTPITPEHIDRWARGGNQ